MPSELWQDPSSMIWYLRSSTSSNDLSFPTAPVTVGEYEHTKTITLTNSGSTPASVELSFDQPYLKGVDPDHGDPTTPSYVVDPDASPRIITVERDSAPPVDPSLVNITLTGNAGLIASIPVNVAVLATTFATEVRTIATPGLEWLFDGNFDSTGSIASRTLTPKNSLTATASSEEPTLEGYTDITGTQYPTKSIPQVDFLRDRDRSWIYVWKNITTLSPGYYHIIGYGGSGTNGLGWILSKLTYFECNYNGGTDFVFDNIDGTHSTPTGTATTLSSAIDKTSLLVASYNLSANEMTWRWKQRGDAAGHTYRTQTSTLEVPSGSSSLVPFGWSSGSTTSVRWRYAGVIDAGTSAAQFDDLANNLGL